MTLANPTTKINLVVLNEHTLGYIQPELPNYVNVLHASILRGAPFEVHPSSKLVSKSDNIRLATEQDFEDYRCSFDGYKNNNDYVYSTSK